MSFTQYGCNRHVRESIIINDIYFLSKRTSPGSKQSLCGKETESTLKLIEVILIIIMTLFYEDNILRILCEKYLQHQQNLYHVFIDFKKAFGRVWHAALWATMRKYNISANLVRIIEQLYDKATSAVHMNGRMVQNNSRSKARMSSVTHPLQYFSRTDHV